MNAKKISLKLGELSGLSEFIELPWILKRALREVSFGCSGPEWVTCPT